MGMHKIQAIDLTSSQPSVTFSAIPQTYKTLVLKMSARTVSNGGGAYIRPNGSSADLTGRRLYGTGSSVASDSWTDGFIGNVDESTLTANVFGSLEIEIPNYAGSLAKAWSADSTEENNAAWTVQAIMAGLWNVASPVTSLTIAPTAADSFAIGCSFALYGID